MSVSLAERNRKEKWSADPRNTFWSQDTTKFGYRMMAQMGWSEGKGLGANLSGQTEHVKVTRKRDMRGIGAKKSRDDDWIESQDMYSSVLASLNVSSGEDDSESDGDGEDGAVGRRVQEELDERRLKRRAAEKKMKSRSFYSKFTRAKDLSNYKADDLAAILGTKKRSGGDSGVESAGDATPEDEARTITKTESIWDYFKAKSAKNAQQASPEPAPRDDAESDQGQGQEPPVAAEAENSKGSKPRGSKKDKKRKRKRVDDDEAAPEAEAEAEAEGGPRKGSGKKNTKRRRREDKAAAAAAAVGDSTGNGLDGAEPLKRRKAKAKAAADAPEIIAAADKRAAKKARKAKRAAARAQRQQAEQERAGAAEPLSSKSKGKKSKKSKRKGRAAKAE